MAKKKKKVVAFDWLKDEVKKEGKERPILTKWINADGKMTKRK